VRPTDEDQAGSRRPNLMSSTRRSANEVNILDMLDRQAIRPAAPAHPALLPPGRAGPGLVRRRRPARLRPGGHAGLAGARRHAAVGRHRAGRLDQASCAGAAGFRDGGEPPLVASGPPSRRPSRRARIRRRTPRRSARRRRRPSSTSRRRPSRTPAMHAAPAPTLPQQQRRPDRGAGQVERDPRRLAAPAACRPKPRRGQASAAPRPMPARPRRATGASLPPSDAGRSAHGRHRRRPDLGHHPARQRPPGSGRGRLRRQGSGARKP
jgi:hypothetical protein